MRPVTPATALLATVAAILVIAVAAPRVAEAHAEPERSNPAAGSTIPRAPDVLQIWFTQELFRREGANTIVVVGPDGRVDDGNPVIDSDDRTHLTVGLLPDLPAGSYEVSWTSLSAIDGVTEVAIDLNVGGTSQVTITAEQPVSDEAIAAAVAEAGYAVVPPNSLL